MPGVTSLYDPRFEHDACGVGFVAHVRRQRAWVTTRPLLMAIERGKLQDCIFDNRALASHRAMAAILGVILKLPSAKQILATEQIRSRNLVRLLEHARSDPARLTRRDADVSGHERRIVHDH